MGRILIWIVRMYQLLISPVIGPHCRFYPSCSHYSIEAIEHFGLVVGIILSIRRILRCHPWHPGGFDPIPLKKR
jgi:putative membrane protein insertion efficiency factor